MCVFSFFIFAFFRLISLFKEFSLFNVFLKSNMVTLEKNTILDKSLSFFLLAEGNPLDSETLWIGDFWSKNLLLKLKKYIKY